MKTTKIRLSMAPLAFLAVSVVASTAQAVNPPPDGGYPGFTTAEGTNALKNLTTGIASTGVGWYSLFTNSTGNYNTGVGAGTLALNTANENTATGAGALLTNTTGLQNTANGAFALLSNTQGSFNTANGYKALFNNTTGGENTAIGRAALLNNTSGSDNIAVGISAGQNLTTGDNNIDIGNAGVAGDSDTIRIGASQNATFIAGIRGVEPPVGVILPVLIDLNGQLGTTVSSRRFKQDLKPMNDDSEAILALKPVTFRYKSDPTNSPQFGLIAEEMAAVNPDLVVRNQHGEIDTVRYDAVNAMLLNEFLKKHHAFVELKKEVAALRAIVKQQAMQIQKVNARLEMTDSTSIVAENRTLGEAAE